MRVPCEAPRIRLSGSALTKIQIDRRWKINEQTVADGVRTASAMPHMIGAGAVGALAIDAIGSHS